MKGFYYDDKMKVFQIFEEGVFADSSNEAKLEAEKFFKRIKRKAKICSVELGPNELLEGVF